jgi:hypothetical protein
MKKKILLLIALLSMLALLPSCALLYNNLKMPSFDLAVAENAATSAKVGTSSCVSYLWLVSVGDCSTKAAMDNGSIAKVHHVDWQMQSYVFHLYEKMTTIVYGE